MMPEIATILRRIPREDYFPGPDEVEKRLAALVARNPGLARRQRVGSSRLGEPIHLVSIGSGHRDALVFAGPHPNEPVGFLTVCYLAELLCNDDELRDQLGYTWHFIGCVDPDGARLNESWFSGPLTRRNYARWHYRPPFDEQVEWTFPRDWRESHPSMPETRALADVIDTVRPALMCSLHNAEFGGVYYYVSEERPGMAEALADLSSHTGIPVHTGDPDIPGAKRSGPGVFVVPPADVIAQAVAEEGEEGAVIGASSVHYASRHGTYSLIIEVPMWSDPRSGEDTDCGQRRAELLRGTATMLGDISPRVGEFIDPVLGALSVPDSPFVRSLNDLRRTTAALGAAYRNQAERAGEAGATVAERLAACQTAHTLRLRTCGTALRLVEGELAVGNHSPAIRTARRALNDVFDSWADEAEADAKGTPVPLSRLVGAQLGAVLTAACRTSPHHPERDA
ncbi:zinc carboxypeptidase [Acrocarpospora pleiomorpha]|uniref:Zinc carboxypeptidase n=1 Tax=Acrocarpospora pleiomorpha TaxID=90975 RepID=A0A5M3XCA0_9ACTN|nr:M14 family zinc carboxypeptidase [Acrocarpospora pleiomorpha]GES18804.1 zinc carboxypeptidase [Acrocarpospora pleiomorpha]